MSYEQAFNETYPKRVTGGEDGVYRWSVDINLKEDHYMRDMTRTAMLIVIGICCVLPALMILATDKPDMAWIPLAVGAVVVLIAQGSFLLYRLFLGNTCTMGYELDDTCIRMIRSPKEQRMMRTMAPAMLVLGAATGHAAQGAVRGAMAAGMAQGAKKRLGSVRRIREDPARDMFVLRGILVSLQVWAPRDDYEQVKQLLREGVARNGRNSYYSTL